MKSIKCRAHKLHRILLLGAVSVSLLGVLSGCQSSNELWSNNNSVDISQKITSHQIQSKSLDNMLYNQFRWPRDGSDVDSDASSSDIILHDGYVEDAYFGHTSDSDPSLKSADYFSGYGKDYLQIRAGARYSIKHTPRTKRNLQKIRYHINERTQVLTFFSTHADNSVKLIAYQLIHVHKPMDGSPKVYTFKPILLQRFGHRRIARIPSSIGDHNKIKIQTDGGVHYKHSHSLNDVQ